MARKVRDATARTSMMIAVIMHVIAILVFFVWAAKTGRLDNVLKRFDVVLAPKAKKPEPPKEEKKPDNLVKPAEAPKVQAASTAPPPSTANLAAPPPTASAPAIAPPAVGETSFFGDGAKVVETATNAPVLFYKNLIEYAIRANWERPIDITDDTYLAEAEIALDANGRILRSAIIKGSGDKRWDDSVRKALQATKSINRSLPQGFPDKFLVRFDVMQVAEPLIQ